MSGSGSGGVRLRRADGGFVGRFFSMASPCEVLVDTDDRREAENLVSIAADEARRIEAKYSRYRDDSVVQRIHHARGRAVAIDEETSRLLRYAGRLFELSDGRFDVTSGVLRQVWTFDGSARVPEEPAIQDACARIGWTRVTLNDRFVRLEPGMEIDLGGIGKEYACDRAASSLAAVSEVSCLVNLGGDLAVSRPRRAMRPWRVGIEHPSVGAPVAAKRVDLVSGAMATSGDAKRYVMCDGVRYGHILDPTTGRPVRDAPRSVTVAAGTCLDAGMLATFAMLHGPDAEAFLDDQGVRYWALR